MDKLSRCNLILGYSGGGKTTLMRETADSLDYEFYLVEDLKIDSIKEISEHNVSHPRLYCFENIEAMSIQSQNALLKVVEDGNSNMYYALTANTIVNVLPTIISRSTIKKMKPITKGKLKEYFNEQVTDYEYYETNGYIKLCSTYGDVDNIIEFNNTGILSKLVSLVDLIERHIKEVAVSNALNILDRLKKIYDSQEVYLLFLKLLINKTQDINTKASAAQVVRQIQLNSADRNRLMNQFFLELKFN
jgi:replication-associated recombination protein RarA